MSKFPSIHCDDAFPEALNVITEQERLLAGLEGNLASMQQTNEVLLKRLVMAREALFDIYEHTLSPFEGQKWLNYAGEISKDALKQLNGDA